MSSTSTGTSYISFVTGGSASSNEKLRITSAGNVGIGTSTPNALLHLVGSTSAANSIAGLQETLTLNTTGSTLYGEKKLVSELFTGSGGTAIAQELTMGVVSTGGQSNSYIGLQVDQSGSDTGGGGFAGVYSSTDGIGVLGVSNGAANAPSGLGVDSISSGLAGLYGLYTGTGIGNALRLYSSSITTSDLAYIRQSASNFSGTALHLNMAQGGGTFTGNFMDLQTNFTSKFTIHADGSTGIGTSTESGMLVVQSVATTTMPVLVVASSSGSSYLTVGYNGSTTLSSLGTGCVGVSSGSLYTTTCGGGALAIGTAITGGVQGNVLFVNSGALAQDSGFYWDFTNHRLGINSTTPNATLVVQGSSTAPTLPILDIASSTGASFMRVTFNGNVGIGTTTAQASLSVVDIPASSSSLIFQVGSITNNNLFVVQGNGNVGIGTSTITQTLTIAGSANILTTTNTTTAFQVQNSVGAPILLVDTTPTYGATTTNYLINPGFELGTTGWTASGTGASITRVSVNKFAGLYSLKLDNYGAVNGLGATMSSFSPTPTANSYTLSFYARTDVSSSTFNTLMAGYNNSTSFIPCTLNSTFVSNNGWNRYSCSFTSSGNVANIFIGQSDSVNRTIYVDAVQLQLGGTATPYSIGNIQLRGVISSPVAFQSLSNSVAAFQIQDISGASNLFIADTLNGRIGIGTATPTSRLSIQNIAGGQDILDIASSSGASLFHISANGFHGINTSTPSAWLHVAPTSANTVALRVDAYGAGAGQTGEIRLMAANNTNYQGLKASSTGASNLMLTLPGVAGSAGNCLLTDASSQLYFGACATGAGTAAGSAGQIQFNGTANALGANSLFFWDNSNKRLGVGSGTPITSFALQGSGTDDLFDVASSSGVSEFRIISNGNVGIGTTTPRDSLEVAGNILLGQVPNSTAATTTLVTPSAGTFGADSASGTTASVVFGGKVFVATKKNNAAAIYRFDGGTTWTRVTAGVGQATSTSAVNITGYAMTVYNGKLFIGSQTNAGVGGAFLWYSTDAATSAGTATWVQVNSTAGTFINTAVDGITDFAVFNGNLYFTNSKANAADVVMYLGGSFVTSTGGFMRINNAIGKLATGDSAVDADDFRLLVYGGRLYAGAITGSTTARLEYYDGVPGTWTKINTTNGQFTTTAPVVTGLSDVTALAVYNGEIIVAAASSTVPNNMVLYKYIGGLAGGVTPSGFEQINSIKGKLAPTDAVDINSIGVMRVYNGRLYAGTVTASATSTGAFYEYDPTAASTSQWTMINNVRGAFGSQGAVDEVDTMVDFNGVLYIGTYDLLGNAGVYTWSKNLNNSYALRFDSGIGIGRMSFVGGQQANDNSGRSGSFIFSHALALNAAAFDYAEDYPTVDNTLEAGDVVQIDSSSSQMVKKASSKGNYIGIVSERPGFRLSINQDNADAKYIPIALAGRVPVKVSTENGIIHPGDFLTISSIPGVAAKAVRAGQVVGQALESYDGQDIGKIVAFVNVSYFNGENIDDSGVVITPADDGSTNGSTTPVQISTGILKRLITASATPNSILSEVNTDRVVAGLEVVTPRVTTNDLLVNNIIPATGNSVSLDLSAGGQLVVLGNLNQSVNPTATSSTATSTVISFDSFGNAFFAGKITTDSIKANSIEGLNVITNQLSLLSGQINQLSATSSTTTILGLQVVNDSEFNGSIIINGLTKFTNNVLFNKNVNISGDLSLMDGLEIKSASTTVASIDNLGNAIFAGNLSVATITAASIETPGLSIMSSRLDSLESSTTEISAKIVTMDQALQTLMSASSTQGSVKLTSATVSNNLQVSGLTTLNGGLAVDSIGSSGNLLNLMSDTLFFGRPYFTTDTAGFAVINPGQTSVDVTFDRAYLEQPIVNVTITLASTTASSTIDDMVQAQQIFSQNIQYLVVHKNENGFTILINHAPQSPLTFSWVALAVKSAKTFSLIPQTSVSPVPVTPAPEAAGASTTTPVGDSGVSSTTTPVLDAPTTTGPSVTPVPAPTPTDSTSTNTSSPVDPGPVQPAPAPPEAAAPTTTP